MQKNGFKLSKNLSKIWESGSLFDKHKLQLLLFPDGFAYDKQKGRVQIFRTNVFFDLMRSISTTLSEIKNGDSIKIDQIPALVTSKVEKSNFYRELNTLIDWEFINQKTKENKIKIN